jgi:peptide/nickel transport system permease protein
VNNTVRRLLADRSARWALATIVLLIVAAAVGPLVVPYECHAQIDIVRLKNQPPSWAHPFGTDQFSRDLLARVLCGARISLAVGMLAVAVSMTIGTAYGLIAGYAGGRVDGAMMRVLDAFLSIPRVLLLIAVLTLSDGISLAGMIVLLGTTGWFGISRLVRAETLIAKRMDYIEAARALGTPTSRILSRHILPNVFAPVIVAATLAVGNVIALEAGLSYLGAGVREPDASWGAIFLAGVSFSSSTWWILFFPGIAIVGTVLAFNVLGDALRDVLDPRQLHAPVMTVASSVAAPPDPERLENG